MAQNRRAGGVWCHRLGSLDRAGDDRRDGVKARDAAIVCAEHIHAVKRDGGVAETAAAEVHKAGFALVAFYCKAGDAGEGLGKCLVREASDRVGGNDFDDIVGVALGRDGCCL